MKKAFETERLVVRPWTPDEADQLVALRAQPGLNDFSSGRYANLDHERAVAFIAEQLEAFEKTKLARMGVFLKSGEPVGILGLFKMRGYKEGAFEIGYRFPQAEWGKGYGREAAMGAMKYCAREVGLNEMYACVAPENPRSLKVVQAIGMVKVDEYTDKGILLHVYRLQLAPLKSQDK